MDKEQLVYYVGKKEVKRDTVAGTATIWNGYGDAQLVSHKAAVILLQHPDVWVSEAKFKTLQAPASTAPQPPASIKTGGGESTPDRLETIKAAILLLETGNEDHFNGRTGAPLVGPVREIANDESISAKEVSEAWDALKATK